MIVVVDQMIREGLENTRLLFIRYSRKMVFDSLVSLNLYMPYKIETMVHELIKLVRIRFHIGDGLLEVI